MPAPPDLLVHLRRARDHVDRYYTEPLDLGRLACVAGISKYLHLTTPAPPMGEHLVGAIGRAQDEGGMAGVGVTSTTARRPTTSSVAQDAQSAG